MKIKDTHILLLSTILILIIYGKTIEFSFTEWDDPKYIIQNEDVLNFDLIGIFTRPVTGLYTPITLLTYAIENVIFGLNPSVYHLTNIIIHIANVWLLYWLLNLMKLNSLTKRFSILIFASHPLSVEAIGWIADRKDLLMVFFILISFGLYIKKNKLYTLFFLMAMLSKPSGITFPGVLFLYDYLTKKEFSIKGELHLFLPSLISISTAIIGFISFQKLNTNIEIFSSYEWYKSIFFGCYSFTFYIYKFIFPVKLSHFYPFPSPEDSLSLGYIAGPLIIVVIAYYIFLEFKKGNKQFNLLWIGFFILSILPALKYVNIGYPIAADRYFYFSGIGIIVFFVDSANNHMSKFFARLLLTSLVCIYSVLSFIRLDVWENNETLWKKKKKYEKETYFSYKNLGVTYEKEGKVNLAITNYHKYLQHNPNDVNITNSLANLYLNNGDTVKSIRLFKLIIKQDSAFYLAYYNLANIYKSQGKNSNAIDFYKSSLKLQPDLADGHNNLAVCYILTNDTTNAYFHFEKAYSLNPQSQLFHQNFSRIKSIIGEPSN